ncbi:unnamed protein product [Urochloa humidicola]
MAASPNGAMLRMAVPVAACIVMVLLSMGPLVKANDAQDDNCLPACVRACTDFASQACKKIIGNTLILKLVPSFLQKCKEQVSPLCAPTCNNFCMMLTPSAPAPAPTGAAPPPCKP